MKTIKIYDDTHADILMLQSFLRGKTMPEIAKVAIREYLDKYRDAIKKRLDVSEYPEKEGKLPIVYGDIISHEDENP